MNENVSALQLEIRVRNLQLCATHPNSEADNFGLVPADAAHYFYTRKFWPRIDPMYTSLGNWNPEWEYELKILCSQHLPEDPNAITIWHEEFPMIFGTQIYKDIYQQLKETVTAKNLRSLVVEKDGKWVREVDGADMSQAPVRRIYTKSLFDHFELPTTGIDYQGRLTFNSTIADPDTQVLYEDEYAWAKLFETI